MCSGKSLLYMNMITLNARKEKMRITSILQICKIKYIMRFDVDNMLGHGFHIRNKQ